MLYDISQPVFGCCVYPGDPEPEWIPEKRIADGALYNLSAFSMCAHNGTHIDAPAHFLADGKTVEQLALTKMIGPAYVADRTGTLGSEAAGEILAKAKSACSGAEKRILFRGGAVLDADAARVFAEAGTDLIGTESQSVGPIHAPMEVHLILLKDEVILLEGIRLDQVAAGAYFLCCTPLLLNGAEGAPCRAILSDTIINRETTERTHGSCGAETGRNG